MVPRDTVDAAPEAGIVVVGFVLPVGPDPSELELKPG